MWQIWKQLWPFTDWAIEENWWAPVNLQDQTSPVYSFFLRNVINTVTLANPTVIDSRDITLSPWHGVLVWETIVIKEWIDYYQWDVLSVNVNIITLDTPLDRVFPTSSLCERCLTNMNVDWSVTPKIFYTSPIGLTNVEIDVTKINFHIQDSSKADGGTFWGLPELIKWVVLRQKDGKIKNYLNIKSNWDLAHHCDNLQIDPAATWTWQYNVYATMIFAGQANSWVVVRLKWNDGDRLEVIIQDDLTWLTELHVVAHWHIVTN